MEALPSGTVTFLFTDIEGSTKLAQQYPDQMPSLLARHHEILNQSIQIYNGYVFQVVGDSFAVAFHSAIDALNAALNAQQLLQNESWTPAPIKVRMGIHTGAAQLTDDDQYSGYATLALTQRIMSAGHGGQVLLSAATRELVRDSLSTNTELLDLGEKRLKDLLRPEHIFQLNASGLSSAFTALKTLDSFPNNLPTQLTSFIGRENEIAEVKQELDEHRLVTLTGSGGTGKTRLSLQVAAELLEKFDHGVWFVELAPLTDPDLIPQTILSTIGIQEQQGRTPLEVLKEYFHEKQALVVLDNCEHLVSVSAQVVNTLLNAAPRLKVMASSREALGVRGEVSYPVPSLSLPDIKHLPVIEQFSQYEAVRLFIDRALLVAPHFVVNKANAPFIAQICYRLDGIPLAIELAAARVKVFSVEQISTRLDDRFRLLTGGARTALPRQQTLRALIDWSYDILSDDERSLLRRLSIFAGGWTLEAAEEVCAGVERDNISPYDILDLLTQLINKSLVVVLEQPYGRETRYRMLETIRQYAREKLMEAGNGEDVRKKHFEYYLQTITQIEREFYGQKELKWLVWLDNEVDNVRVAIEWSIENRPQDGLELVNCLGQFLMNNWRVSDMENWLSQLVPHPENSAGTAARANGLLYWAQCIGIGSSQEDISSAQAMLEEGLFIYKGLDDKAGIARYLMFKGYFHGWMGEPSKGSALLEEALVMLRELNDKPGIATALGLLGFSLEWHETERKLAYMQESLSLDRELGYVSGMIESLKQLGSVELRLGHFEKAHIWLDEALAILQEHAASLGNTKTVSYDVGDLAYYEGDYELAQKYYEDCLAWAERVASSVSIGYAKVRLGYLSLRLGDLQEAGSFFREALQLFVKAGNLYGIHFTLEGLAGLAVVEQNWERAGPLFGYTLKQMTGPRPPVEQASIDRDLAILRANLSEAEFSNFTAEGSTMSPEQVIALALEE
jgi:predicted ATPase/class 3 adenylate cyclase